MHGEVRDALKDKQLYTDLGDALVAGRLPHSKERLRRCSEISTRDIIWLHQASCTLVGAGAARARPETEAFARGELQTIQRHHARRIPRTSKDALGFQPVQVE